MSEANLKYFSNTSGFMSVGKKALWVIKEIWKFKEINFLHLI
jgi:hypothetical protein